MAGIHFGVLGPMSIRDQECRPVVVSAGLQRGILAVLLLHANRVVARDELAERLWDGRPPGSARITTATYVSRLRQALGPALGARILTRPPGYLIEVGPEECDLLRLRQIERRAGEAAEGGQWARLRELASEGLGLWRGEPFEDVPVASVHRDETPALDAARVRLAEWGARADLRLGRADAAIETLTRLVERYPLREPLYEQLIEALATQGRRAEALEIYRRARRVLRDQLGLDPSVGLERAHRLVFEAPARRREPAASRPDPRTPVPHQLPPVPRLFAGRSEVLEAMTRATRATGAAVLSVVGTGGIGKTATALAWSHRMLEGFPDGQLFADLRGFDPEAAPVEPAEVLGGFLQALGVSAQRVPAPLAERVALYRTLLADRRMLIVLDNALDAAQVRELVPGGPGCLTVVTSRDRLAGLVVDGAQPFGLGPLTEAESLDLLSLRLGAARVAAHGAAFARLVALCAGLPLALAVVAARMALEPGLSPVRLAERLASERGRLAELAGADAATDPRSVFSWSFRQLSAPAATLFVHLGLHPGPTISSEAAACLAGFAAPAAEEALRELVECHLLAPLEAGRFQLHDLLRLYALELAGTRLSHDAAQNIRTRIFDHYTTIALAADRLTTPARLAPPGAVVTHPGCPAPALADAADARAWLESELPVLLTLSRAAGAEGFDRYAWQLPWALSIFLDRRGEWTVLLDLLAQAAAATRRLGESACWAWIMCDTGLVRWRTGDLDGAPSCLDQARAAFEEIGDHTGLARLERTTANFHGKTGDNVAALASATRALDLARRYGDALAQALALTTASWYQAQTGHYHAALELAREGLDLNVQAGYTSGEADALDTMALAYLKLGDVKTSLAHYRRALAVYETVGERYFEALSLARIADLHELLDEPESAVRARESAWEIVGELDLREDDVLRTTLGPRPADRLSG